MVKVSKKLYSKVSLSGKILKSDVFCIHQSPDIAKGGVPRGRRDQGQSEARAGDREPHPGGPELHLHLHRQEQGRADEEADPRHQ